MPGIFISYRRTDATAYAMLLLDELVKVFGPDRVFIDLHSIPPGTDFELAIDAQIHASNALLALIDPQWAARDAAGWRRLDDSRDLVRREIVTGIERCTVIPVLLDDARMPTREELPSDLAPLATLNAVRLRATDREHDLQRLVASLRAVVQPSPLVEPIAAAVALLASPNLTQQLHGVARLIEYRAVGELAAALTHPSPKVAWAAAKGLAELKDARAIPTLRDAVLNGNAVLATDDTRTKLVKIIAGIGNQAVAALVEILGHPDTYVRQEVMRQLGSLREPTALEALVAGLHSESFDEVAVAVDALGELGDPAAIPFLVPLLTNTAEVKAPNAIEQWKAPRLCDRAAFALLKLGLKGEEIRAQGYRPPDWPD